MKKTIAGQLDVKFEKKIQLSMVGWTDELAAYVDQYWPMPMVGKNIMGWSPGRSLGLTSSPSLPDNSVTTLCVTKYLIKYFFVTHTTLDYPPINQHCKTFLRFVCHRLNRSNGTPCPWRFGSHGPSHHPKLSAQHRSKSPFHTSSCWFPSQVIWSLVP